MRVHRVIYWTDSSIVLRYIRNTSKRFKTSVSNRLQVIHDASSPYQWRNVPTKLNPADLASRDLFVESKNQEQQNLHTGLNGPKSLWQHFRPGLEEPPDLHA